MRAARRHNPHRPTRGFGLVLGVSLAYLSVLVLLPLGTLILGAARLAPAQFLLAVTNERALAAFQITFAAALCAALVNVLFGLIIAWVLVRYEFPGRRLLDAAIDLPFALPTAVAGIALTAVFARHGVLGAPLARLGIDVAFTQLGIGTALVFIGLPFVVRTLQPVLEDLDPAVEEAAQAMGASPWQTFCRVTFPELLPGLLSGFTLAFARAIGEYGAVVFIAGNMPMRTEVVSLLIMTKLEQYDYAGATALATVMLVCSFVLLLLINLLSAASRRRLGFVEAI